MGKGINSKWNKIRVHKLYEDDYEPSNKVIRKRMKERDKKEIKIFLEEEKRK